MRGRVAAHGAGRRRRDASVLCSPQRERFLAEARRRRVAPELVVVDTARRPDKPAATWEERILDDGSAHAVYKRYLTAAELGGELGGGEVLFDGRWFVIVAG